jgi:hypothetical protein
MTLLDLLARACRQYERGCITADELVNKLTDCFAHDADLQTTDAIAVAALIPPATRELLKGRIEAALSPGYHRRAFRLGGRRRTKEEEDAAAMKETAREQAWAAALRPLLS